MTLFSDFLKSLGVRHTEEYSDTRYRSMPFRSLFGLSKLLQEYGVATRGVRVSDPAAMAALPLPFIAATPGGMVIVTDISGGRVSYLTQGVAESMPLKDFVPDSTGVCLLAQASARSVEPGYAEHARMLFFKRAKRVVLVAAIVFLAIYFFIANGLWRQPALIAVTLLDIGGLWLCYMLMGKMLNIKSAAADRVCGVLQKGGCDDVLKDKASTFFGIFSWSEVGFTYFSVSLVSLLAFPQSWTSLAAINICCLPFTVWSISYQKFVLHRWCTLCVGVQCTLWLIFFAFLAGGYVARIFPLDFGFVILGCVYLIVLLTLNRLSPYLVKAENN